MNIELQWTDDWPKQILENVLVEQWVVSTMQVNHNHQLISNLNSNPLIPIYIFLLSLICNIALGS